MTPDEIAAFHTACASDNDLYQEGKLSRDEYWSRVHARDAQVSQMSPEDRAKVNTRLAD